MSLRTEILNLHDQGVQNITIARTLGCSKGSVTYHLGVKYHGRGYYVSRRKEIKRKCVEYKGGKCVVCSYNRCFDALEFHHLDPATKDKTLMSITRPSRSFEQLKAELDKCVMLCCRCHREVHAGILELPVGIAPT